MILAFMLLSPLHAGEPKTEGSMVTFEGKIPSILRKTPGVQYDFNLKDERFFLWAPSDYDGKNPFGLLTFLSPADSAGLPEGWGEVLKDHHLLFLAPQKIGNEQPVSRRTGLPLVGILKTMEKYRIDPDRIYVSGFSGGGRVAVQLAFFHPELISGVLSCSGTDFYKPVERIHPMSDPKYGLFNADPRLIVMTRNKVPFIFVTGGKDPRHDDILDIFKGGFLTQGFHAKMLDDPAGQHAVCSPLQLREALSFLDATPRWTTSDSKTTQRLAKALREAQKGDDIPKTALEAWKSETGEDFQRYAAAEARFFTRTTDEARKFDFMLAALDDPQAQMKGCQGACNILTKKIAEEHKNIILENPNLKKKITSIPQKDGELSH